MRPSLALAAATLAFGGLLSAQTHENGRAKGRGHRLQGLAAPIGAAGAESSPVNYNGGPVMLGQTHIYYIYYGDWSVDLKAAGILNTFANNLAGSGYYNILTQYSSGDPASYISNSVIAGGSIASAYVAAQPTNLNDSDIQGIVEASIGSHSLPLDANGIYFVLTAPGVGESSGFLSSYCGWHNFVAVSGTSVKYAFVGDAGDNHGCSAQFANSPNGDPPVDAMITVLAHELFESVTDPLLYAWYDTGGDEIADKCAWHFGTTFTAPNGSTENITLGSFDFLIQQEFSNATDSCVMTYAGASDYTLSASPSQNATAGNYTVTVNPTNGFNGAISLSVSGLPAGASANPFTPNPASTTSSFTVSAGSAAAGTYILTITGASGSLSRTAQATLVVTVEPPDFSLSVAPAAQTLAQGNATTNPYVITVTPVNGFSNTPALTVTTPAGTVVNWLGLTSFTVTTSPATTIGSYPLTVTGVSGSLTHSIMANLVVNNFAAVSPALSIAKVHSGNFTQEQTNAVYTVTVSNQVGASATSGPVTVAETLPTGLVAQSMSGAGWSCSSTSCNRSDSLLGGSSYPPITVTVDVASSAPSQVINQVSVSGGGSAMANATDPTTIAPAVGGQPAFFSGEVSLGSGVDYLQFANKNLFGYHSFVAGSILYHYEMGYEAFVAGAEDSIYLYDFSSSHWLYSSSTLFPYLYDFTLKTWIYYFLDTKNPGHYTTNPRYFSNLTTGQTFTM